MRGHFTQLFRIELAAGVAHPVLGRADLVDHIAAALQMVGAESAFAGIHVTTG